MTGITPELPLESRDVVHAEEVPQSRRRRPRRLSVTTRSADPDCGRPGDIRGFADRGTWKFRQEDVDESPARASRIPIRTSRCSATPARWSSATNVAETGSSTILAEGQADVSDEPTVIRKGTAGAASDSDVKLVGTDSDSDITLAPGAIRHRSDSDVKLIPEPASDGSDSDVQLIDPAAAAKTRATATWR